MLNAGDVGYLSQQACSRIKVESKIGSEKMTKRKSLFVWKIKNNE